MLFWSRMARRGKFVTFEGLDGSGKTTQLEMLARRLKRAGVRVTVATEPGGTRIGAKIREVLLSSKTQNLAAQAELLLYFASRAQNVAQVIEPALAAGRLVLCDRFTDSSLAYQGYGRQLGRRAVMEMDRVACRGLKPDHTVLIEISPRSGVGRALDRQSRASRDESRIEREGTAFFRRVHRAYQELARQEPKRVHVVDGRRSIQEIHEDIWALTASWGIRKR